MTDAIAATETTLYQALADGVTGAAVYQHAPQDVPLPVVLIGDLDGWSTLVGPEDPDQRGSASIIVLTEGEERAPCTELISQVVAALDGKHLALPGWIVAPTMQTWSAVLSEEGNGYVGIVLFTVIALSD